MPMSIPLQPAHTGVASGQRKASASMETEMQIDNLVPAIRRSTQPSQAARLATTLERRPLDQDLDWVIVVDDPLRLTYVSADHLKRWDLSPHATWRTARRTLETRCSALVPERTEGILRWEGHSLASSALYIEGWLEQWLDHLTGSPIAFVPTQSTLWVIGSEDPRIPSLAQAALSRFRTDGMPLSPCPIGSTPSPPLNRAVLDAFLYAEQAETLLETAPEGVFIAPFRVHNGTTLRTSTGVLPGHECWLPLVDEVVIGLAAHPWPTLDLEPLETRPARYRFPG